MNTIFKIVMISTLFLFISCTDKKKEEQETKVAVEKIETIETEMDNITEEIDEKAEELEESLKDLDSI